MIELSNERIGQILSEETPKNQELATILRGIYTRYMRLYERYFADTDALNDEKIADLRNYHEETQSLVKHYYLDIPMDICLSLGEFEQKYTALLLGDGWREYLSGLFRDFRKKAGNRSKEKLKAEFAQQALAAFYEAMDYVFRDGFGTASETASNTLKQITGLLFGEK